MSESNPNPIVQVTLGGLLAHPARPFVLKVVIDAWAGRDLGNAANDAWLLLVALAGEDDRRLDGVL